MISLSLVLLFINEAILNLSRQTATYGIIILIAVVLGLSIIFLDSQSVFSEQLIYSTTEQTEKEISNYLNPIAIHLQEIKNNRKLSTFDYKNEKGLNDYFIPIIAKSPRIASIKYFDREGRQFLIYKEKNTFVSTFRIEKTFNNEVLWKRWKNDSTQVSQWKETVEQNPFRQNWVKYFKEDAETDSIFWFSLKRGFNEVFTGELNAVTIGRSNITNNIFGLAIGLKTDNLISSLPELRLYSNPKVFLLNHNSHILPIITSNIENSGTIDNAFTQQNIDDSVIVSFLNNWKELGRDSVSTFTLNLDEDKWWAQVDPLNMHLSKLQLGVIITEANLIFGYLFNSYVVFTILLLIILITTILYIYRKRNRKIINSNKLTIEDLNKLLAEGESQKFELKSSLRWDYRDGKVNKKLEEVIVKSISAFNNAEGGYLVIGIDDDNNILGLEKDYLTLNKQNSDYFELHLRNLIGTTFTVRYASRKLTVSFLNIEEKDICIIKIAKGEYPLFLKTTDRNGNKIEKFYIRSGNSSQEITTLTEINNYLGVRFKNKD